MTRTEAPADVKRVLIVEDDPDTREMLRDVLSLDGYTVSTAANGREGLDELVGMERPCLILLDLMMPEMNGLEFLDAIREDPELASIPVIVVTAYHELADSTGPVAGFVPKPVQLRHLLDLVREHCKPDRCG